MNQRIGYWYELIANFQSHLIFMVLLIFCCFRSREGAKSNEKCSIAIADLVLMYNRAIKGLYSKVDIFTFDF